MAHKAILFDMDGTLLTIDTEAFVGRYMKRLGEYTGHLIAPDLLVKSLWKATKVAMQDNSPNRTNADIFEENFLKFGNISRDEIWPVFDRFYEEEFPLLRGNIEPHPAAIKIVKEAQKQGYRLVVATNPVFPEGAIMERLKWTGIEASSFEWITFMENSHYCKPNPRYFQEISERLGIDPGNCIMIGNDMQQDMVAKEIGMKTYLVTDYKIDRGTPQYAVDGMGTLHELYQQLSEEKGIFAGE
ncbi:HAD family hydrolase [Aneurinibacillus sp. Ricciae_BoGa-3]|uniref:HAD family hydrolase n=1 Tax=Aneurinibacillus sp. Ricciae_BoGa-3 TaxID=3022697 RepID=UPI00234005F4|nr:HAD family hydrolase [Aneurinibacillus sp. Ricciae_BoGa-3]WCK55375.1 HAD family hydrolase [Aneurinibacillus sp. Ricciae_BoGa-3]